MSGIRGSKPRLAASYDSSAADPANSRHVRCCRGTADAARASLARLLLLAACGSSGSADRTAARRRPDAGAGGVSFGGQQDIGEFRGILDSGGIPGPDTLDANGFFNEHYAPPPATGCRTRCA